MTTTPNRTQHTDLAEPLLIHESEDEEMHFEEDRTQSVWLFCGSTLDYVMQLVVSVLLPTLLAIQFRLAFSVDTSSHYPMEFLYEQIFFFGLAGWLYRMSLTGGEEIVIQLWPEISTDVLLLLILYQQTSAAIFLLDVVSLALAIHAAWNYWDQMDKSQQGGLDGEPEPSSGASAQEVKTMSLAVVV